VTRAPGVRLIDYWDPVQADLWLSALPADTRSGRQRLDDDIIGPDRFLGIRKQGSQGHPAENGATVKTWQSYMMRQTATVSVGNIYRFKGLTQVDILTP